jgi:hypothetical protein
VTGIHRTLAFVIVLLALGGTIWAVRDWLRHGQIHPRLLSLSRGMSAAVGVQALLGIILALTMGRRPADGVTHFVVGPLTLLVLPVTLRVIAGRPSRHAAATLAVAWFVLLLLTLRAVGSGGSLSG